MTRYAIALLLVLLTGGAIRAKAQKPVREPDLLPHTRRIVLTAQDCLVNGVNRYPWIDDHRLLAWRQGFKSGPYTRIFTLDADTGHFEELRSLTARYQKSCRGLTVGWQGVSPDGRRVLWTACQSGVFAQWYSFAAPLDGQEPVITFDDWFGLAGGVFTPDQMQWVSMYQSGRGPVFEVFALTGPQAGRRVKLSEPLRELGAEAEYNPLGLTREGRIVAAPRNSPPGSDIVLCEFGVEPGAAPVRTWVLHSPEGVRVDELALSRQGDRLAWLGYVRPDPRAPKEDAVGGSKPGSPPAREELWVSNLDGSAMRRVGSFSLARKVFDFQERFPQSLHWAPDGKRVSFTCAPTFKARKALYIVSVD